MKETIKIIIKTIHVISFCLLFFVYVIGVIYEIIGRTKFEKIISSIGLSNGSKLLWIVGITDLLLFIATYFIKHKFFDK